MDRAVRDGEIVLLHLEHLRGGREELAPRRARGGHDRVAGDQRQAAGDRAPGVRGRLRVRSADRDVVHGDAERRRGDLLQHGGTALAEVAFAANDHRMPVRIELERDRRAVPVGHLACARNVQRGADADAPAQPPIRLRPRCFVLAAPAFAVSDAQALGELATAHLPVMHGTLVRLYGVAQPELDRIHTQLLGEAVHVRIERERDLRPAETAKAARGDLVGVDELGPRADVLLPI